MVGRHSPVFIDTYHPAALGLNPNRNIRAFFFFLLLLMPLKIQRNGCNSGIHLGANRNGDTQNLPNEDSAQTLSCFTSRKKLTLTIQDDPSSSNGVCTDHARSTWTIMLALHALSPIIFL